MKRRVTARKSLEKKAKKDIFNDEVRLGRLENALGFNLRLAQEASFRAFAKRVGDPDLKPRRYAILTLIYNNPGLTQTQLGRACGREKSSITPALQQLVRLGYVERRPQVDDRRASTVWLTAQGTELMERLAISARAHDKLLESAVGKENRALFIEILKNISALCDTNSKEEK